MTTKAKPHWIAENERPKSFKWICSECGSTVYDMPMCNKKNYKKMCLYQYCPYCGVKMDLSEVAE
jgi:ribosomal protein L33